MNISQVQQILSLVDAFGHVERKLYRVGSDQQESDVEHSFELAMMSWFLALEENKKGANFNTEKVILYALTHDLVEVYAGDTDAFNSEMQATKHQREAEALQRIRSEFVFFPELVSAIQSYEDQADAEAVFVKSLDKIIPALKNMRDGGRSWKHFHGSLTLDELSRGKEEKIKDPRVLPMWRDIHKNLEESGIIE